MHYLSFQVMCVCGILMCALVGERGREGERERDREIWAAK